MTGAGPLARGVASGDMAVLRARSFAEAREYMIVAMSDCDREVSIERTATFTHGDQLASSFLARCAGGPTREFTFTVDPPARDEQPLLFATGSQPSELLDAGQWYAVVNRYVAQAQQAQQRMTTGHMDEPTVTAFLDSFGNARAAAVEVLKFIPGGQQVPPDAAFWSEYGQAVRRAQAEQLTRPALEQIVRDVDSVFQAFQSEADRQARGTGR